MNAIDFLTNEHAHLRHTLMTISNNSLQEEAKQKIFNSLCRELIRHEEMEHKLWYPCFKNKLSGSVKHLLTEEKHAEKEIKRFDKISDNHIWEEKFTKFRRELERHAREEEHDLFPEVKKLLSDDDLERIGVEMYQYKKEHPIA
jgi:hemerythrin superfamily protein